MKKKKRRKRQETSSESEDSDSASDYSQPPVSCVFLIVVLSYSAFFKSNIVSTIVLSVIIATIDKWLLSVAVK